MAKTSSGAGLVCVWRGWWSAYEEPLVAKSPELGLTSNPPNSTAGWGLAPSVVSAIVRICVFGRWDGDTLLWIFAVFWCGSLELLGWPWLFGAHPLACTADPGWAHCNTHSFD